MIYKDSHADQTIDEDVTFTHVIPIIGHGGIRHGKNSGSQIWLSGQKMAQKQGIQHEHIGQKMKVERFQEGYILLALFSLDGGVKKIIFTLIYIHNIKELI